MSAAGLLERSKGRVPVREAMIRRGKLSFQMRRLSRVGASSQERQSGQEFQEDFFRFTWERNDDLEVTSVRECVDVVDFLPFKAFILRGGRDVDFSLVLDTHDIQDASQMASLSSLLLRL